MSVTAERLPALRTDWATPGRLILLAAVAGTVVIASLPRGFLPKWMLELPRGWRLGLDKQISAFMKWLVEDATLGIVTVKEVTRGFAWMLDWPLTAATSALATGLMDGRGSSATQILPPLPWVAVVGFVAVLGWRAGGGRLALIAGGSFLYLAVFGQWGSAMTTLASIVIAAPLGVAGGLLLGIAGYRHRAVERVLTPVLDLMQTVPVFAYLVPILFLFGFGPVAAMIATMIYAMPPMVRVTIQALAGVPSEIEEYGRMAGCTRRQMMWKVLVPAARPMLMVGVNQVIMLSLNMVIIASMIGAGGLGYDVLASLRRLDIGAGLEAGVAIVVLAIALDRLARAFAAAAVRQTGGRGGPRFWPLVAGGVAAIYLLGLVLPWVAVYPAGAQLSTAPFWGTLVEWLNINFFDTFEAMKTAMVLGVLVPVKRFMLSLPWPWVMLLVAVAGWRLGGWRLSALLAGLVLFIAFSGQWTNAMETVYLCGVSVLVACLAGIPIGVAAGLRPGLRKVVETAIDTLQTLPSFVYLIPVVMLFRVGDFTAMIAVVLYAIAPAVRYTAHGIAAVNPALVEAGIASGCTPRQLLWKIRLPLARADILLGVNQTIMLALSMLVITALVGTRDLGQEVYIALTKADTGRGIVAGLCVAFIAITADRLVRALAARMRTGGEPPL